MSKGIWKLRVWVRRRKILCFCTMTLIFVCVLFSDEYISGVHTSTEENASNTEGPVQRLLPTNSQFENLESSDWNQEWESWNIEQGRRRNVIQKTCMNYSDENETQVDRFQRLLDGRHDLSHLLVDDSHKTIYCYIPKVGCSNWKRMWMILTGASNATDIQNISNAYSHDYGSKMTLSTNLTKKEEVLEKLESYLKVIVVRHPTERLISAYLNKIHHERGHKIFQKVVLQYVRKHRKSANLTNIEWTEFVDFLASPYDTQNEHWRSYNNLCYPFLVDYDVIVKFETIDEDSERLLRLIGAPDHLHFPQKVTKKVDSLLVESYLQKLNKSQLEKINLLFDKDFAMFEYEKPLF